MDFPKWITEDAAEVYYRAAREEFGRVVPLPISHGQSGYAWSTVTQEGGSVESLKAAKRGVELAYDRRYHPERFHADHEVHAGDAGKGGDK